jgi:hypothetical protein
MNVLLHIRLLTSCSIDEIIRYFPNVSLILYVNFELIVVLPQRCSLIVDGKACQLSPSFIVSINAKKNEQYMIGVVCKDHMKQMEKRLEALQAIADIPKGVIHFQPIKIVSTNCIIGTDEDYMEIESKRNHDGL